MRGLQSRSFAPLRMTATGDPLDDEIRRQRQPTVIEQRTQPIRGRAELDHEERAKLRIAVLFDDEAAFVAIEERANVRSEGKRLDAHVIEWDSALGEAIDGLVHRRMTPADR